VRALWVVNGGETAVDVADGEWCGCTVLVVLAVVDEMAWADEEGVLLDAQRPSNHDVVMVVMKNLKCNLFMFFVCSPSTADLAWRA
jgi:hypothetical protein